MTVLKIYATNDPAQADFKVYFTTYAAEADVLVYRVARPNAVRQAGIGASSTIPMRPKNAFIKCINALTAT